MKKFVLIIAAAAMLFGCKKKDDSPFKKKGSYIYIQGIDSPNKSAQQRLTIDEIFAEGKPLCLWCDYHETATGGVVYSIDNGQLDVKNKRLKMEGKNVISEEDHVLWEMGGSFLKARNFYITYWYNDSTGYNHGDTLGYIPNSVIRSAQADILDLWREGAIAEIYERFNESFYFTPCTGEEFRAIKEDIDWENEYNDLLPRHAETHLIRWD